MTPEPMILELADGTQIAGTVSLKGGYLCIQIGGWLGMGDILLRPKSATQVCGRILEILDPKGTRLPATKEPTPR
jgi:hypothetical protein